jgi:hypothetical protein
VAGRAWTEVNGYETSLSNKRMSKKNVKKECQKECQKRMPKRMSIRMSKIFIVTPRKIVFSNFFQKLSFKPSDTRVYTVNYM